MNVRKAARFLNTSPDSVRRWLAEYAVFMSPSAVPAKGETRRITDRDLAILVLVASLRESGLPKVAIADRLRELQADDWRDLPPAPQDDVTVTLSQAYDAATIASLQREIQHTRGELQTALAARDGLQVELDALRAADASRAAELHRLEVALAAAEGKISTLQARLEQYSLSPGRPVPLLALVAVTTLAAVLVTLIVFILARLLS